MFYAPEKEERIVATMALIAKRSKSEGRFYQTYPHSLNFNPFEMTNLNDLVSIK